ncbi:hypothetical protein L4D77_20320 [Photobacterium frigidiphilum]
MSNKDFYDRNSGAWKDDSPKVSDWEPDNLNDEPPADYVDDVATPKSD